MNTSMLRTALCLALATGVVACGDSTTGPEDDATVTVAFRAEDAGSSASRGDLIATSDAGEAGVLVLDGVWLVVDEFKLEGNEGACEVEDPEPDCGRFEAEPHLLAVPIIDGEVETLFEEVAPLGTFNRLKFETKASGDADVQAAIVAAGITDWPGDASLLVTGTFSPDGVVEPEPFRVFFDAEVKIELDLPDPLVVTEDGPDEQVIFIVVDPDIWFLTQAGLAMDLTALDFDLTGQVHELEVKLEDGFTKIELGG